MINSTEAEESEQLAHHYGVACEKLEESKRVAAARLITEPQIKSIRDHIDKFLELKAIDIIFMGSVELSSSKTGGALGSVSSAVAKGCVAEVCVVKNFATT